MPKPRPDTTLRRLRWLTGAAVFAVAPKCLLCFAGYLGLGAWLGLRYSGREICSASDSRSPVFLATSVLSVVVASLGFFVLCEIVGRRRLARVIVTSSRD